ncbi:MAG: methylcrotonoyl-CoA carboxylase, partial [Pseudomonadota bacterium]
MPVVKSTLDPTSPAFAANAHAMEELLDELQTKTAKAALGGSERARERHTSRGKLLPRERVERLLDPGAPFL